MRYGILGAGQLARMLVNAADALKLQVQVLAQDASDPAARVASQITLGDWKDPVSLGDFLTTCDQFVFENEFVPESSFKTLAIALTDPRFSPRLSAMMNIQDKLEQKDTFKALGLPSAPYHVEDVWTAEKLKAMAAKLPGGFVLKWSRLGYDGKGTWISPEKLNAQSLADALEFTEFARAVGVPVYLEEKADFIRELAVVGSLSTQGEWKNYPVVISEQTSGVCRQVYGPAVKLGVSAALCEEIETAAEKIARNSDLHGTMALEVFQIGEEDFWINEIAPRVHNSGHFSLDGGMTSQFENHWRAVTGMPLGKTNPDFLFFMRNILGEGRETSEQRARETAEVLGLQETYRFHWYEKSAIRPGRKMGHVNYWNLSLEQLNRIRGME